MAMPPSAWCPGGRTIAAPLCTVPLRAAAIRSEPVHFLYACPGSDYCKAGIEGYLDGHGYNRSVRD